MPTELLGQLTATVTAARTTEELTRPLLVLLELVTGLESTYLTQVDAEAGVQNILYARNSKAMQIPEGLSVPWEDTLCKRALDEGRPFTEDVAGCWGDSDAARDLGIQTYVTTPVRLDDGTLFGTLCAASNEQRPITAEGRQVLSLFGELIQQQIRRERLLDQLQQANRQLEAFSFTDALTGLPNRRAILQELHRLFALAQRDERSVLVVFVDLDGFKQINDVHGHEAGDAFLVEVGKRLSHGIRSSDQLGRLGGDEYVIVGMGAKNGDVTADFVAGMHARLTPLLQGHFDLAQCTLDYPGASFGIVSVNPVDCTPEEALRQADAAMYENKRARKQPLS